ncbi:RNA-directed DNA polymerase [Nonomuraea glycinis]|uniref:Reverse transcriptase domain-containing protein n=1 Tax=Nonomuraea glycinis TaxID=2047744 RepID=A0A918A1A5_9ACTN|nr:RNA-directed DNA polymerase [Nonomuraea glycinis]MCA2182146.1 RNA-directed DNA polymerase [Nonomuraea glycinis]GGP02203.1 hypothetical protein GCM10012278_08500 [Nonomuraea glycinis]
MPTPLQHVADEALLKKVWRKEVRPALRRMTFSDFNMAPDPLHYAAYEWGLETLVAALAKDLQLGRYSPEPGEIVRMAKGKGLSRPLCFLAPRDALVYSTITWLARSELTTQARKWVGVAHGDKGTASKPEQGNPAEAGDSFDWFRFWLARQGHILQMVDHEQVKYFVESDIANFYPSIRLEAVREHLHSQTSLEKEVVRLCIQIIDRVMPRRNYSEVSLMGLPQEHIGASREIAHSLLFHVDEEFDKEGQDGRYTRYMDDILIGVKTPQDGERCVARLQRSLETLGLYPNAAKTTVTSLSGYLTAAMVETNAQIDRITEELKEAEVGILHEIEPTMDHLERIQALSVEHRVREDRPKRWGRVTRRIYTLHRRVGVTSWWDFWRGDIDDDPGAAGPILEYVRSWPLTEATVADLVQLSKDYSDLYANISLLAAEAISSAPVANDTPLWGRIFAACDKEFLRLTRGPHSPERERLAAAWLIAAWKFANLSQRQRLLAEIPANTDAMSPVRVQAFPLLVSVKEPLTEWVSAKPGLAWENAMAAEYLRSLATGEEKAVGVALSLLDPEKRLAPLRYIVLPRAVPLIEIVGQAARAKLDKAAPKALAKLQKNPDRLRDHKVESILAQWCP